jgi:hypothetical protein
MHDRCDLLRVCCKTRLSGGNGAAGRQFAGRRGLHQWFDCTRRQRRICRSLGGAETFVVIRTARRKGERSQREYRDSSHDVSACSMHLNICDDGSPFIAVASVRTLQEYFVKRLRRLGKALFLSNSLQLDIFKLTLNISHSN